MTCDENKIQLQNKQFFYYFVAWYYFNRNKYGFENDICQIFITNIR